jgi:hypothetical protein
VHSTHKRKSETTGRSFPSISTVRKRFTLARVNARGKTKRLRTSIFQGNRSYNGGSRLREIARWKGRCRSHNRQFGPYKTRRRQSHRDPMVRNRGERILRKNERRTLRSKRSTLYVLQRIFTKSPYFASKLQLRKMCSASHF